MGRVSKRTVAPAVAAREAKACYKAGIYARLSSDQDRKTLKEHKVSKNESVEVQVKIAEKYIEDFNREGTERIEIVERYIDLGKTGSNFNRDEFKRLMQDIRLGDIDCVVVKDLSRFGRNYLEAGNYIEKIFPFLGVRFIAVADGLDTGSRGSDTKQMATEIKNLVNDMYAKDFSVKAKQHLKQRRQEGSYVGGPPPYGYKSGWDKKIRKLTPDENTAGIVKHIFSLFIETGSYTAVADDLNRKKVNPPSVYKKTGEVFFSQGQGEYKGWDKGAVERILKSETYTGKLVQGKSSITARDEKNRIHKSEDEWVVRENTHEPVIDAAVFGEAAEVREKLRERTKSHSHPTEGYPIGENIFDSVFYCGVCGRKMTRSSYMKTYADGRKARLKDLNRQKEELEAGRKNLDAVSGKHLAAARALLRLKSGRELTKEMIDSLIRRIYIYPGKRIEVEFAYTNELLEGVLRVFQLDNNSPLILPRFSNNQPYSLRSYAGFSDFYSKK